MIGLFLKNKFYEFQGLYEWAGEFSHLDGGLAEWTDGTMKYGVVLFLLGTSSVLVIKKLITYGCQKYSIDLNFCYKRFWEWYLKPKNKYTNVYSYTPHQNFALYYMPFFLVYGGRLHILLGYFNKLIQFIKSKRY